MSYFPFKVACTNAKYRNKRTMKRIILLIIEIIISLTMYSQNKVKDWNTDLDYLVKELSEKHYNPFSVISKELFLSEIDAIKQESVILSDFQIALKTQQLIAKCGDSHTMLNIFGLLEQTKIFPFQIIWLNDGIFISQTTIDNKEIIGNKLETINNIPLTVVIDSLSTLFAIDNLSMTKLIIPLIVNSQQVLDYFGFTEKDNINLGLKTRNGNNHTCQLNLSLMNNENQISIQADSLAFCTKNKNKIFTDYYFSEEKTYYILYNSCISKEIALIQNNPKRAEKLPSFKEFEERIFSTIEDQPIDKIVFDMRYNVGGSSLQGTALIEKLAKILEFNPTIKMYVVLGRSTFSSAILNAMDFKRLTNAIFVGEETAGKPNHFGEVKSVELPQSKLSLNYSTKYFKTTDEEVNTIYPDVKIEESINDLTNGIDPVYEWIKEQ